jgi:hypothetical protein
MPQPRRTEMAHAPWTLGRPPSPRTPDPRKTPGRIEARATPRGDARRAPRASSPSGAATRPASASRIRPQGRPNAARLRSCAGATARRPRRAAVTRPDTPRRPRPEAAASSHLTIKVVGTAAACARRAHPTAAPRPIRATRLDAVARALMAARRADTRADPADAPLVGAVHRAAQLAVGRARLRAGIIAQSRWRGCRSHRVRGCACGRWHGRACSHRAPTRAGVALV